jgi:prephenate dehydrogenase
VFKQITIVGTGLIGGSLALALKRAKFSGTIVGCDTSAVLAQAKKRKAIDRGASDCGQAVRGSDLIVLATPVGAIIDFLDRLAPLLPKNVFITDVGSTKQEIVARAREVFGDAAPQRFLGGHPMAGKEHGGIAHADAGLFRDAPWFLTPSSNADIRSGAIADWVALLNKLGAHPRTISPERHDELVAWTSHLPQMLATALASSLADFEDRFGDDHNLRQSGGRALREMTRIASSPYDTWRDIALTNTANIEAALLQLEQKLVHIRENLRTRGLEDEFRRAQPAPVPPPERVQPLRSPRLDKKKRNKKKETSKPRRARRPRR